MTIVSSKYQLSRLWWFKHHKEILTSNWRMKSQIGCQLLTLEQGRHYQNHRERLLRALEALLRVTIVIKKVSPIWKRQRLKRVGFTSKHLQDRAASAPIKSKWWKKCLRRSSWGTKKLLRRSRPFMSFKTRIVKDSENKMTWSITWTSNTASRMKY